MNTSLLLDIYDIEYNFMEDINFLKTLISKDEEILELGCGTGRILVNLVKDGFSVDGLDISEEGIQIIKNKLKKLDTKTELFISDMSDFSIGKKYDFIFSVFNSFMMLTDFRKQERCLEKIYKHLNENGKVLLSTANPCLKRMSENFAYVKHQKKLINTKTKNDINKYEYNHYDLENQLIHRTFYYDEIINGIVYRKENKFTVRYLFKYEFILMLEKAGFEILNIYGNWDKSEHISESPNIIVLAQKIV